MTSGGVHSTFLDLLKDHKKGKIIDLGCGKGALSRALKDLNWDITAIDVNPPELSDIPTLKADLNKPLPFKDNTFDVVVSSEVIEHLENIHQFVREIHRILKPGGRCIISTPNIQNWYGRIMFLLSAKFPHFTREDGKGSGHIYPVSSVLFRRMFKPLFKEEGHHCNKGLIPFVRLSFKTNSLMFGDVMIFDLKKI